MSSHEFFVRRGVLAAYAVVAVATATLAGAQESSGAVPQIVTTGVGETALTPDRAQISFAVETRAPTAAASGSENARLQSAVIAALRAKGVADQHITTLGYSVSPNERYDNGQRRVIGYIARNAVLVDVQNIASVGLYIDAALGAGANSVGGLRYYSTHMDSARRMALEAAVVHAKADAEVMARAAGGSLGGPLEISLLGDIGAPRPTVMSDVLLARSAESVPTPVEVGEQTVTVRVMTRWLFISGR